MFVTDLQEQCKWQADPIQFCYSFEVLPVQCKRGLSQETAVYYGVDFNTMKIEISKLRLKSLHHF